MLVKLTPGVNITYILHAGSLNKSVFAAFLTYSVGFLGQKGIGEKAALENTIGEIPVLGVSNTCIKLCVTILQ